MEISGIYICYVLFGSNFCHFLLYANGMAKKKNQAFPWYDVPGIEKRIGLLPIVYRSLIQKKDGSVYPIIFFFYQERTCFHR